MAYVRKSSAFGPKHPPLSTERSEVNSIDLLA